MTRENIKKTLLHIWKNLYFAKFLRRKSVICQILRGKKSVYTDKISMSGRSVLSLPVSGVIINIHEVTCYVSLSLLVVCGNLLSRLQTFITINLVCVAYFRYFCRCRQTSRNSRIYKNNKDN